LNGDLNSRISLNVHQELDLVLHVSEEVFGIGGGSTLGVGWLLIMFFLEILLEQEGFGEEEGLLGVLLVVILFGLLILLIVIEVVVEEEGPVKGGLGHVQDERLFSGQVLG